jgi:hypothetical protein
VTVNWPTETAAFNDAVNVEASDDLTRWRPVGSGRLVNLSYNGQSLRESKVELGPTTSKFLRILWADGHEPVVADSIEVAYAPEAPVEHRQALVQAMHAVNKEPGAYEVDLGARIPVDRINVKLPEANSLAELNILSRANAEQPWRPALTARFYRLEQSSAGDLTNAPYVVSRQTSRYWKVMAAATDGALGTQPPSLEVQWVPERARFAARGRGPYELVFGSAIAVSAVSPAAALEIRDAQGAVIQPRVVSASGLFVAGGETKRLGTPPWKTWILWGVLLAGVGVLAWFAWRLSREMGQVP